MPTLVDSIKVNAPPEKVYSWLSRCFTDTEAYLAWHPDHVDIRWIKGEPMQVGSIVHAEEYLHGELHKLKFLFTKVVPNKEIQYRALFPLNLVAPGNAFYIKLKSDNSCIFTATARYRAGPLFMKLAKKQIEATRKHVKEEGENLKLAVETMKD